VYEDIRVQSRWCGTVRIPRIEMKTRHARRKEPESRGLRTKGKRNLKEKYFQGHYHDCEIMRASSFKSKSPDSTYPHTCGIPSLARAIRCLTQPETSPGNQVVDFCVVEYRRVFPLCGTVVSSESYVFPFLGIGWSIGALSRVVVRGSAVAAAGGGVCVEEGGDI
jgi:hypothetical protein